MQALLDGPAAKPPEDVLPNFQNPPNLRADFTICVALCLSIETIAVAIRLYAKIRLLKSPAYEDCKSAPRSLNRYRYQTVLIKARHDPGSMGKS